jgi:hypothetical protein
VFPPQTNDFQKPIKFVSTSGKVFFGKKSEKASEKKPVEKPSGEKPSEQPKPKPKLVRFHYGYCGRDGHKDDFCFKRIPGLQIFFIGRMPGDCKLLSLDACLAIPVRVLRFEVSGLRRRTPVRPVLLTGQTGLELLLLRLRFFGLGFVDQLSNPVVFWRTTGNPVNSV